jgi:protein tyrosine/serine phosphatase
MTKVKFHRNVAHSCGGALLVALILAITAHAEAAPSARLANIRIDNFGQINEIYYRGAQPQPDDFTDLAALGVKTVIDLTSYDSEVGEEAMVADTGMKFYRIPMTTIDRPSDKAVTKFLELVNDPANQPVFVHCRGGRHRTGAMTAVYRMTHDGWDADQAYAEMKKYRFEGFPGHPELKEFVYDYYDELNGKDTRVVRKSRDRETPILDKVPLDKLPEPIVEYLEPVRKYVDYATRLLDSILANR